MKQNNPAGSANNNPRNRKRTSQKNAVRDGSKKKTKKVTSYPLYIPENIDLDDLLIRYPIDVPNARDKLVYLLHQIHAVPAFSGDDEEVDNGYTILYSPYLQTVVDEYAELISWLINRGIIEIENHLDGLRSKGYRFTLKYRTKVEKVHITTWTLIRRIIEGKRYQKKESLLFPIHLYNVTPAELRKHVLGYTALAKSRLSYITKWLDDKLTLDADLSMQFLHERLDESTRLKVDRYPMRKYNMAKIVVESFDRKRDNVTVDDKAGRLHTVLTRLNSPLRALLKYDGKPLAAADIKNSQPVLSLSLLDELLYRKNRMKERIELYNQGYNNSDYYITLGDLIKRNSTNSDTIKYKELVLSGRLYVEFGKQLQGFGIINKGLEDDELKSIAKKGLLKCLFNTNQAISRERIQWAFKQVFPSVYEVFEFVKTHNYKTLACILQNFEAEIVLHKACFELGLNHPDIPLFTIHDSIATTEENIEVVKDVLSKHLSDALEHPVKLQTEYWNEKYFEKEKCKKRVSVNDDVVNASYKHQENTPHSYGYFDYNLLLVPLLRNLRLTAKELGLKQKNFFEGLRQLNILDDFNHPIEEFEQASLFIKSEYSKKIKWRRLMKLVSVKVTDKGFDFLRQLAEDNPDLFPKKRVRIKRTYRHN